jgi:hypothetical protein
MSSNNGKKSRAQLWNPNTIKRFQKRRGREDDRHGDYRPWLNVQDLPSEGMSTRICGWKTGKRAVHLFSNPELYNFYLSMWNDRVLDFREQFPLDFTTTKSMADRMQVKHPGPSPNRPVVMTTDVRLTLLSEADKIYDHCVSVKPYGSFELRVEDILDLTGFIAKLRGKIPGHDFAQWLYKQFSVKAVLQIDRHIGGQNLKIKQILIRELNRVIKAGHIYSPELFAKIYIRPRSWLAMEEKPREEYVVRLNRLLLCDSFPKEMSQDEPVDALTDRDKEKLRLEQTYWTERQGITWELRTLSDMDLILARNIEAIYPFYHLQPYGVSEDDLRKVARHLNGRLRSSTQPLVELAEAADRDCGVVAQTSLIIAKHLIVRKEKDWEIDLAEPFEPWRPLNFLN